MRSAPTRSLKETILRRSIPTKHELWALRDVNLDVQPGETIGIIGQNGSGKSTLLKLLAGIFAPSEGRLEVGGRVGALLELGSGFHPEFTGVENVYLNAAIYGLRRSYVDEHLDEIIGFAELEEFAHMPVKTYSSGMFTRLGFSVAIHIRPDILLLDEVLAVGDEAFQQKCFGKIWDFRRGGGTVVFVSHNAGAVEQLCSRAVLLDEGHVVEEGKPDKVIHAYHRRLSGLGAEQEERARPDSELSRIIDVRAIDRDGVARHRFVERDLLVIQTRLHSEEDIDDAWFSLDLQEESGRSVGSQTISNLQLRRNRIITIRLCLRSLPVREGSFFVDVALTGPDGSVLATRERALRLSILGDDAGAGGPVRLGGTWEVTSSEPPSLAEVAEG